MIGSTADYLFLFLIVLLVLLVVCSFCCTVFYFWLFKYCCYPCWGWYKGQDINKCWASRRTFVVYVEVTRHYWVRNVGGLPSKPLKGLVFLFLFYCCVAIQFSYCEGLRGFEKKNLSILGSEMCCLFCSAGYCDLFSHIAWKEKGFSKSAFHLCNHHVIGWQWSWV